MTLVLKSVQEFTDEVSQFYFDPEGFIYWAFDWNSSPLNESGGLEDWQAAVCRKIKERLLEGATASQALRTAIQIAVSSGHGVGKTALVSWIILWFISTRDQPQIVVTANTKNQLDTKTWRELAKWHRIYVLSDWYVKTATKLYLKSDQQTWFAAAIPWSKENAESFAGTHDREVLLLLDEASSIEDIIWENIDGAMTTGKVICLAFGNPTRNTGRFRECFRKFRRSWDTFRVDSRTVRMTNKEVLRRWVEDYGEDSDFVRVRVRGLFPRAGANQLIGEDVVEAAQKRRPVDQYQFPIVIGVDPARFGDDQTVIYVRQGFATVMVRKYREIDTMTCAGIVSELIVELKPKAVFVDEIGIGAGVIDRLIQLEYHMALGVNVAVRAKKDKLYRNKRAELWFDMRSWLKSGGCIDEKDTELRDDLTGPEYFYDSSNRLMLESKEDMKDRGIPSPDTGDALALTFSETVYVEHNAARNQERRDERRRRSFMAR